ncbi:hypothetical protein ElyMa_000334200 [Elysia marginata]|uniref:Uncharacterized protein n=1 Tax=Elysia marginata TaxID=1093978 RepID=A0AAV4FCI3_9GAST|nr:hypothetical protein ElyMa_000334200 [Elysia marginata]
MTVRTNVQARMSRPSRRSFYRDDGLATCRLYPRQAKNKQNKQKICKVFQNHGLKITVETIEKIVDFPDVILDQNNDSYKPYKKPNSNVGYTHNAAHPTPLLLQLKT